MFLVQLSDLHVTTPDTPIGATLAPTARLAAAVDLINRLERQPDAVICTGDLVDVGSAEEYVLLRAELDRLDSRLHVVAGNHDVAQGFVDAFSHLPELPAAAPFNWVCDDHDLRLIGLDTTWPDRHDGALDDDRLTWLDGQLSAAPDRPTVIAMHHPPFTTGMWWMDYGGLDGAAELRAIVQRHPQVLRVICGHVHRSCQVSWGTTVVSSVGSLVLQSGLGLAPTSIARLHDASLRGAGFIWDGDQILAVDIELESPRFSVDLSTLVADWDDYERRARNGGPMPRLH